MFLPSLLLLVNISRPRFNPFRPLVQTSSCTMAWCCVSVCDGGNSGSDDVDGSTYYGGGDGDGGRGGGIGRDSDEEAVTRQ